MKLQEFALLLVCISGFSLLSINYINLEVENEDLKELVIALKDEPVKWKQAPKVITYKKNEVCYIWHKKFKYDDYGERPVKICRER